MKKPLLFSLCIWLLLFALPWTRGMAWLDWKSATLERLSGFHPAWAPLDPPYQPEKDTTLTYTYVSPGDRAKLKDEPAVADVKANGLSVAPQFTALAMSSDRDILVWCARSSSDPKMVTRNLAALSRRFPGDIDLLAWSSNAQMEELSLSTRIPGPLSNYMPGWSVQLPTNPPASAKGPPFKLVNSIRVDYGQRPRWDTLALQARQGQKLEPNNGFWWWLEMTCLLGARRDEAIWPVLRAGSHKLAYNDHDTDTLLSLRRAHLKTLGAVPLSFYLKNNDTSWMAHSQWRTAARQVSENVIGARLTGRHKVALEGGRDLMLMGRVLRRSPNSLVVMTGTSIEGLMLQSALPYSLFAARFLRPGFSVQALASHPRSLLRYANEQKRTDIARQIISEWNIVSQIQRKQMAATRTIGSPGPAVSGVSDKLTGVASGLQNTGRMLVQTLPIPLFVLALLSLLALATRRRDEPFFLPAWTRGLGWSAFALMVLLGAQVLFNFLAWSYVFRFGTPSSWAFTLTLPRLVEILPSWAFSFPACVAGVGSLWAMMFAARRGRGDVSILGRLRLLLSAPDDRVGVVNLEPLVQIIGLAGIWGAGVLVLALWFFLPQSRVLEDRVTDTLHDQSAGLFLGLFCFLAAAPALFYRTGQTGFRAYSWSWLHTARRFLVAHIALTTTLYLLLTIAGAFWGAQFEAQWLNVNAPSPSSAKQ